MMSLLEPQQGELRKYSPAGAAGWLFGLMLIVLLGSFNHRLGNCVSFSGIVDGVRSLKTKPSFERSIGRQISSSEELSGVS